MAIADNIWWTRKARIQTEKRLLSNARHAQLLLLWYSFVSVCASIYYLRFNTQSGYANVVWVMFSVLVLCVSGFISGLSYKERAAIVKDGYESMNSLYRKSQKGNADFDEITKEYEQILNLSENHADIDYQSALCVTYLNHNCPRDPEKGLDRRPTLYVWLAVIKWFFIRSLFILMLYSLPLLIFLAMKVSGVSPE
ncbi:MAG: SLATT domain-containing protein [Acidithiobacillus sp.]